MYAYGYRRTDRLTREEIDKQLLSSADNRTGDYKTLVETNRGAAWDRLAHIIAAGHLEANAENEE